MKRPFSSTTISKYLICLLLSLFGVNEIFAQFEEQIANGIPQERGKVTWGDYNNDGQLDFLLVTDYPLQAIKIFKNNGNGTFTEQTEISVSVEYHTTPCWIDFNNDGLLDIQFLENMRSEGYTSYMLRIYKNNGDGTFAKQIDLFPFLSAKLNLFLISQTDFLPACSATWSDFNNDGLPDVLLTGNILYAGNICKIYKNNGDGTFSEHSWFPSIEGDISSASWNDYNNDGFSDILITYRDTNWITKLFKNNGDGTFSEQNGFPSENEVVIHTAWGDYNNDGFLDILLTGCRDTSAYPYSYPISKIYKNNGDGTFSEQTESTLIQVKDGSATWGDYNNDGLLDILLSGRLDDNSSNYILKLFKNKGDGTFSEQTGISLSGVSAAWGDYNNDGFLDILADGKVYKNVGSYLANTVPAAPSNNQQIVTFNTVTLKWNRGIDFQTPQNGLSYNIRVGTLPGGSNIVYPKASTINGYCRMPALGNVYQKNDGYTLNLAPGTYYWSVQAIDNAYAGGPWAAESSFTITSTQASNIAVEGISSGVRKLNWINGNGPKRLVFMTEGNKEVHIPVDSSNYSGNAVFGSGNQIDSSGWYCVYNGTGNEVTVSNLKDQVDYKIAVFECNDTTESEKYNTCISSENVYFNRMKIFKELNILTLTDLKLGNGSIYWCDYNNDGFLDFLVLGSLFIQNTNVFISKIFKNNGNDTFTEQTENSIANINGVAAWGDYNNDGFIDLLLSGEIIDSKVNNDSINMAVTKLYKNNGDGTFTEQSGDSILGVCGSVAWGDYNNDGFLDILETGIHIIDRSQSCQFCDTKVAISKIYKNNGDGTFAEQVGISLPGLIQGQALWGDYNKDGLLDVLMVGDSVFETHDSENHAYMIPVRRIYKNNGNESFSEKSIPFNNDGYIFSVSNGDYNNDGFLDILLRTETGISLYKNNGDDTFSEQHKISLLFNPNALFMYNPVCLGDFNNDGTLDILVDNGLFKNNGDGTFTEQTGIPLLGSKVFGDYDNDGKLDILVIGEFAINIYKNTGFFAANTLPTQPTNLQQTANVKSDALKTASFTAKNLGQTESLNTINLKWDKASDAQTPQNGLSYNIRIGTTPGSSNIVNPMASEINGFRRIPDLGNVGNVNDGYIINNLSDGTYYWSVQAIDNAWAGGPWATESTFTISNTNVYDPRTINHISIYPNPTNNFVQIKLDSPEQCLISIFDINGKVLLSKLFYGKEEQLNLYNFNEGLYIIKLKTNNQISITKLMIAR